MVFTMAGKPRLFVQGHLLVFFWARWTASSAVCRLTGRSAAKRNPAVFFTE